MNDPMQGPRVRWRSRGHELQPETDVLRFEVADLNRVITRAVADGELYRDIQDAQGHPEDWQVLPMSCFAETEVWTPARLAYDTGFTRYRVARAAALIAAGFTLWPTEVFNDDVPDPRNDVHYDLRRRDRAEPHPGQVDHWRASGAPSCAGGARSALRAGLDGSGRAA